jgi:CRISPR-associated endonuclease/helicase Cas3
MSGALHRVNPSALGEWMDRPIGDAFWAKLDGAKWHPFIDHCADVAACAQVLLEQTQLGLRLATLANLPALNPGQQQRLGVLAALHDLGKPNFGFQAKCDPLATDTAGHVREGLELLGLRGPIGDSFHENVFNALLPFSPLPETVADLLAASICHHGRPELASGLFPGRRWEPRGNKNPLAELGRLMAQIRTWFPLAFTDAPGMLPGDAAFAHGFSGLITLADWLGSDRSVFPFSEPGDLPRFPASLQRAREAFARRGLIPTAARKSLGPGVPRFDLLSDKTPRQLQTDLLALPAHPGGSLTVLEAETGSGKTEAALARFLTLFHAGEVDGLYFALPTRTAATQIFERVTRAVRCAFPTAESRPPVTLAVPGYLSVDGVSGVRLPHFEVLWNDDDRERYRYRGWASEHPKRYLAGAIVVGTIDQLLLGALRVGHAHLRGTAALRHLLVVDEVHASDAYMNRLLETVVARHAAAGGHTLLMSATLGSAARERLLRGQGNRALPGIAEANLVPYPAVSHREGTSAPVTRPTQGSGGSKTISISCAPLQDEPARIAALALEAARRGARVLVIRNTVKACVATQQALEALVGEGERGVLFQCAGLPAPHHARFAREDRTRLDRALEEGFGLVRTGGGRVAIATQTVQQSLDLDADLLLSDLCPMDVLLQRLGRLHRHVREERPAGFATPRAVVLVPAERELGKLIGKDGQARGPHGVGHVYEDLRVLDATWAILETTPNLVIPEMNRALVEATTHPEALAARVARFEGEKWKLHAQHLDGRYAAHRTQASLNLIDWKKSLFEQPFPTGEERISTRLGAGDRVVPLPPGTIGAFEEAIAELTLPSWLAGGAPADAEPTALHAERGTLSFSFGDRAFVYDRLGLRSLSTPAPQATHG